MTAVQIIIASIVLLTVGFASMRMPMREARLCLIIGIGAWLVVALLRWLPFDPTDLHAMGTVCMIRCLAVVGALGCMAGASGLYRARCVRRLG